MKRRLSQRTIIPLIAAVALIAAVVIFYVVAPGSNQQETPEEIMRRPAPDFSLRDISGHEVTLESFRGKPAVIYLWAAWCPLCRERLDDLAAAIREGGDAVGLAAIYRGTRQSMGQMPPTATGTAYLVDPDDTYYAAVGGFAMPETLFLDGDGVIRFRVRGAVSPEELHRRIQDLTSGRE